MSAVLFISQLWFFPSALVSQAALLNVFRQFQRCFEAQFGVGENESASLISIQTHDVTFFLGGKQHQLSGHLQQDSEVY